MAVGGADGVVLFGGGVAADAGGGDADLLGGVAVAAGGPFGADGGEAVELLTELTVLLGEGAEAGAVAFEVGAGVEGAAAFDVEAGAEEGAVFFATSFGASTAVPWIR